MKKSSNKLIIVGILIFLFYSCIENDPREQIEIYGYTLGDTLTNEFEIIKIQDFPFSRAILRKDKRVKVSLVNNHIISITYKNLNPNEQADLKKMITKTMESSPEFYDGNTPYNVKIEGEAFYWNDTIIGTEVLLERNLYNDASLSTLSIYNHEISDSLLNFYAPEFDSINFEIMGTED